MQYCVSNYLHRRGTSEKASIKSDVKKSINIFNSNILKLNGLNQIAFIIAIMLKKLV